MTKRNRPAPRSLQEWMENHGVTSKRLLELIHEKTGRDISPTALSFILRGSRRCSAWNADTLYQVTGIPHKVLMEWPKVSDWDKSSGERSSHVA